MHNRKDNQVTVSLTVEYIDQQTKATQVSQFDLVLEKNGSNWKIIEIINIGTLLQLFCNHVLSLIKN
ncbi:conjugal transfer protein [Enterococcus faecalis]|nr:conjugal transfer protein [Enterococcus faecalis]